MSLSEQIAKEDFGIVAYGRFFPMNGIENLFCTMEEKILLRVLAQQTKLQKDLEDKNYTVKEVAKMTNRAVSTITNHCRLGLIKAYKGGGGKCWLIPKESYVNYRYNIHD